MKDIMRPKLFLFFCLLIFASLACQSTGPLATLLATPTATPTITPSATPTFTPSPFPTSSPVGVAKEKLDSGETLIIDYDNGYVLLLSQEWFTVPADAESLKEAMGSVVEENPELASALENMKVLIQDDTLRFIAFNTSKEYRDGSTFTNLFTVSISDPVVASLPMDFFVELNVEQIRESSAKAQIIDSGESTNINGIPYGYIVLDNNQIQDGISINARQHILVIKKEDTMTLFTLTVPGKVSSNAEELIQQISDSLYSLEDYMK